MPARQPAHGDNTFQRDRNKNKKASPNKHLQMIYRWYFNMMLGVVRAIVGNQLGNTLSYFWSAETPASPQDNVGMPRGQEVSIIHTPPTKHIGNIVLGGRGKAQWAQVFPNSFPQP